MVFSPFFAENDKKNLPDCILQVQFHCVIHKRYYLLLDDVVVVFCLNSVILQAKRRFYLSIWTPI